MIRSKIQSKKKRVLANNTVIKKRNRINKVCACISNDSV